MPLSDPAARRALGANIGAEVTGRSVAEAATPYEESWRDFIFAEVWSRPGLDRRARFLVSIAGAAFSHGRTDQLDDYVRGALRSELISQSELLEAALHLSVYGGWSKGGELETSLARITSQLGLPRTAAPPIRSAPWDPAERDAEGAAEFVNVMKFPGGPPASPYLEAIRNFVFGEMWCREGLDQRARRWLTLVGVCESCADTPIRSHIHAAMASGNCTPDEMQEFVLQYGIHAGWPKASRIQGVVFEMSRKVQAGLAWDG